MPLNIASSCNSVPKKVSFHRLFELIEQNHYRHDLLWFLTWFYFTFYYILFFLFSGFLFSVILSFPCNQLIESHVFLMYWDSHTNQNFNPEGWSVAICWMLLKTKRRWWNDSFFPEWDFRVAPEVVTFFVASWQRQTGNKAIVSLFWKDARWCCAPSLDAADPAHRSVHLAHPCGFFAVTGRINS